MEDPIQENSNTKSENEISNEHLQKNQQENLAEENKKRLEEFEKQESNIKTKRSELETSSRKVTKHNTKKNIPVAKYDLQYMHSSDEEECTFHPKINPKSERISTIKRNATGNSVSEILYKDAHERFNKEKESQKTLKDNLVKNANSTKMSNNSFKIIMNRIKKAIQHLIEEIEKPEQRGSLNFENLGMILSKMGVFQNLEFGKTEEKANQSALSLNQSKVKPERLSQEIAFHENFWNILNAPSKDSEAISSELLLDILIVLVEETTSSKIAAQCITEIIEKFLPQAEGSDKLTYNQIKEEKKLWGVDKVVIEFRKLFNDKTIFMNFYSTINNNLLTTKSLAGDNNKSISEYNFKPTINPKSKELTANPSKSYVAKMASQNNSGEKQLKNRHDILFEHHKYLKEKKKQEEKQGKDEEIQKCTFKPQITEFKSPKKQTDKEVNEEIGKKEGKGKRHEILYQAAKDHREKIDQISYEMKRLEEEKELSQCTFQPRINYNIDESILKNDSNFDEIKGFRKTVERIQKAEFERAQLKSEKEKISRGENYEKLKQREFRPPSFLSRGKVQKEEVLVYVDVNVAPGKTGRIGIHKGDDVKALAESFSRTYSLNSKMKESLETLLQSYFDTYMPKEGENQETEEGNEEENQEEGENEEENEEEQEENNEDEENEEAEEGEEGNEDENEEEEAENEDGEEEENEEEEEEAENEDGEEEEQEQEQEENEEENNEDEENEEEN